MQYMWIHTHLPIILHTCIYFQPCYDHVGCYNGDVKCVHWPAVSRWYVKHLLLAGKPFSQQAWPVDMTCKHGTSQGRNIPSEIVTRLTVQISFAAGQYNVASCVSQSQRVPVPACPSPILSQSQCVPVPVCPSPSVS